jgi:hypothetical protein
VQFRCRLRVGCTQALENLLSLGTIHGNGYYQVEKLSGISFLTVGRKDAAVERPGRR